MRQLEPGKATADCPDEKASLRDQGMASCAAMDGPISRTPQRPATDTSIALSYCRGTLGTGNESPLCTRERADTRNVPDVSSSDNLPTTRSPSSPLWTPWHARSITCAHKHMITSNPTSVLSKRTFAVANARQAWKRA